MGPCAGGAAYSPTVTDMIIMVEKQSFMFLTGPEVIKSVTGEIIDMESLGGAAVHLGTSGTAHLTAPSDKEAIALARRILSYLPSNNTENPPFVDTGDDPNRADEELNHIVPANANDPYNMHEVINHIVDRGSFIELQATFATNAIIGLSRMGGYTVGIVAQEPSVMAGAMEMNSADKIARFVRFCDAFNIPLLTFCDSPGFLPGVASEHEGVIRHGAKVLFAYSEATVPKIQVTTRKGYGGAYIVMSSKLLGADLAFRLAQRRNRGDGPGRRCQRRLPPADRSRGRQRCRTRPIGGRVPQDLPQSLRCRRRWLHRRCDRAQRDPQTRHRCPGSPAREG